MTLRRALLRWHERNGRTDFPWRRRRSTYRTLVSEFMLQQTQVDRVIPKFAAFMQRFPTLAALAAATPGDVLREWKSLGYNARAIRLRAVAAAVMEKHGGRIPRDATQLRALPGVGEYTAAAIRAFAYDLDDVPVDVNIRRVLHRLGSRARRALGTSGYALASALMDFGAQVCTARAPGCAQCPIKRHCEMGPIAVPGARGKGKMPFEETTRFARGRIIDRLRDLAPGERISLLDLHRDLRGVLPRHGVEKVRLLVDALDREGLLVAADGNVGLP